MFVFPVNLSREAVCWDGPAQNIIETECCSLSIEGELTQILVGIKLAC